VLGAARGMALIESRPGVAGVIVQRTDAGTRVMTSSRFPAMPVLPPDIEPFP
jgi:hypothetical protein